MSPMSCLVLFLSCFLSCSCLVLVLFLSCPVLVLVLFLSCLLVLVWCVTKTRVEKSTLLYFICVCVCVCVCGACGACGARAVQCVRGLLTCSTVINIGTLERSL